MEVRKTNTSFEGIIKKVYFEKDKKLYLERCGLNILLPKDFYSALNLPGLITTETQRGKCYPSKKWVIEYKEIADLKFSVSFQSIVNISKLVPVYYIQHQFQVNIDDESIITPVLDGYDYEPYTKEQEKLRDDIKDSLSKLGYSELSILELDEVIAGLEFPKDVKIFGPQVTVEHALFVDILDLCED